MPKPSEDIIQFQKRILQYGGWRSCLNCDHWQSNKVGLSPSIPNRCVKFNVLPPLDVIVMSCPEWMPNVPF